MKTFLRFSLLCATVFLSAPAFAQEGYHIKTIFCNHGNHSTGGYVALGNKFTTIRGQFANLAEVYGGWYINHRWLIGAGFAATTNTVRVPEQFSAQPGVNMSYGYGQAGLMTEYVFGSDKAVHVAVQLFAGSGFTFQYQPFGFDGDDWNNSTAHDHDENYFAVAEPGVKIEVNVFRWLRLCPGISYRMTFESEGKGLSDDDLSGTSLNMTIKIGRF
jgi:hypothetical protein